MAGSQFEYTREYEQWNALLPQTYIVVRVDGRGFSKFADTHGWAKPWDDRALRLAESAAKECMSQIPECTFAYGQSDEFSFLLPASTRSFERREQKLITTFASAFAAAYSALYPKHFDGSEMQSYPSFDARAACFPSRKAVRDYFSWRQADCHANNQYNQCFWALVWAGHSRREAHEALREKKTPEKNEMLFSQFGINYKDLPSLHRRGVVLLKTRVREHEEASSAPEREVVRRRLRISSASCNIIRDGFWEGREGVLDGEIDDLPDLNNER